MARGRASRTRAGPTQDTLPIGNKNSQSTNGSIKTVSTGSSTPPAKSTRSHTTHSKVSAAKTDSSLIISGLKPNHFPENKKRKFSEEEQEYGTKSSDTSPSSEPKKKIIKLHVGRIGVVQAATPEDRWRQPSNRPNTPPDRADGYWTASSRRTSSSTGVETTYLSFKKFKSSPNSNAATPPSKPLRAASHHSSPKIQTPDAGVATPPSTFSGIKLRLPSTAPATPNGNSAAPSQAHSRQATPPRPAVNTDPNDPAASNLPPAFLPRPEQKPTLPDKAARLQYQRYAPLPDLESFIKPLTSHEPSTRSTDTLRRLSETAHKVMVAWQNEYLRIDKTTAPLVGNPSKKPATGGRTLLSKESWDRQKEIDAWGHPLGLDGVLAGLPSNKKGAASTGGPTAPEWMEIPDDPKQRKRAATEGISLRLVNARHSSSFPATGPLQSSMEKRMRRPVKKFDAGENGSQAHGGRGRRGRGGLQHLGADGAGRDMFTAPGGRGGVRKRGASRGGRGRAARGAN